MAELKVGRTVWVGVIVKDVAAARRFYSEIVGLKELDGGEEWAHFSLRVPDHLLEILPVADEPPFDKPGFRPGFQVEDIEAARKEMIARGAKPVSKIQGSVAQGGRWCSFEDMEGNYFELKQVLRARAASRSAKKQSKPARRAGGKTKTARKRKP
jgi:predicted enzyme related to lactoylglutathione lyase